jgi:hypothetical protein
VTNYNHSDTGQQNITSYICLMRMSETSWNQYLSGLEVTHKEIREDLNGGGGGRRGDGGAGVEAHGRGGVEADAVDGRGVMEADPVRRSVRRRRCRCGGVHAVKEQVCGWLVNYSRQG